MKKILLCATTLLIAVSQVMASKTKVAREDQTLLTIDNNPVSLGEFEYLYHKNNSQQIEPQTIDQYLELFINYKLKVAEAEAAGIDTTKSFKAEFSGYARDLAQPYLIDTIAERQLIDKIYDRLQHEVNVSHIMMRTGNTPAEREANRKTLDSLRNVINNGGDFKAIARQYSIDNSSNTRGGNMGYITALHFPYTFEDAAYDTPDGQVSDVIETPYGYHIVMPLERRQARGQVLVQHILKLTQGATADRSKAKLHEIDSIHALLMAGADFDELATRNSDDPGSARQGGRLPWFSTGRMVKEFEDASFALKDGEISPVIESPYGYHIIKRIDSKSIEPKEQLVPQIKEKIAQDERGTLSRRARLDEFKQQYKLKINRPAMALVESIIARSGGYDSIAIDKLNNMPAVLAWLDETPIVRITDVVSTLAPMDNVPPALAYNTFNQRVEAMIDQAVSDAAIEDMSVSNAEYRNLLNEYRDGILLFEISDRNVWSRAKNDTEGLNKWFDDHRDKYKWDTPKFKSYIIFATSDSVLQRAHAFLEQTPVDGKDLAGTLRQLCGRDIRVERVIAAKGENAIIDYLAFNGEKPVSSGKWIAYEAYNPVILDAPAEVADERSAITTDYQAHLEEAWIKSLRAHHKVKVNKNVLKQAK